MKKVLSLVALGALTASLVACGGGEQPANPPKQEAPKVVEEKPATAAPATGTESTATTAAPATGTESTATTAAPATTGAAPATTGAAPATTGAAPATGAEAPKK